MVNLRAIRRAAPLLALAGLPWAPVSGLQAQTVVTSASPERAEVESGGSPLRLELRGKGLERIRGVEAVQRGEPLRGVDAKILRAVETALWLEVVAGGVVDLVEGVTLVLSAPEGPVRVPVELRVVPPPPLLRGIEAPTIVRREGAESLAVVIDRPAPRGGFTLELASSEPGVLAVPREVTIPEGEIAAKAEFRVSLPTSPTRVRVAASGATGRVDAVIEIDAVEVAPPPSFEPQTVVLPRLFFTGTRFRPVTLTLPGLHFTGTRFRPVSTTTPTFQFTGTRGTPS